MRRATIGTLGIGVFGAWLLLGAGAPAQDEAKEKTVQFAGLAAHLPQDWHETQTIRKDCYKRYQLDAVGDSKYNAMVYLCRLDKDNAGTPEDQVKRWQAMFLTPDGKPVQGRTRTFALGDRKATAVDLSGAFRGFPDEPDMAFLGFRLIGVVVPTPDATYQAVLVGPEPTVEFYRKGFEGWLKDLH